MINTKLQLESWKCNPAENNKIKEKRLKITRLKRGGHGQSKIEFNGQKEKERGQW